MLDEADRYAEEREYSRFTTDAKRMQGWKCIKNNWFSSCDHFRLTFNK